MNHNQNRTEKNKKMKLPVYFRQSWQIMLKDRQYSLIYIIGVALSMALVSSVLIFMVMMLGNVYPESHRGRTMLLTGVHYNDADDKYFGSTSVPDDLVRLVLQVCRMTWCALSGRRSRRVWRLCR